MMSTLKSDLRKLLTVRSTYIMIAVGLAFISLFAWFGTSAATYEEAVCEPTGEVLYSRDQFDPRLEQTGPEEICDGEVSYVTKTDKTLPEDRLLFNMQETVPVIVTFASVVVILFMAHEFRYNTINYTLTLSNRRSKVLLSKMIVTVLFTVVVTLLAIGVSTAVAQLAISAKDLTLPAQDYNWLYVLARHLGYALVYTLLALGIITLIRNLVAGIAAIFLLPTIDSLAGYLLAANWDIEPTKSLPFSALERFGNVALDVSASGTTADMAERFADVTSSGEATAMGALAVIGVYLVGLWIITWILFIRRDAN